MAKFCGFWYVRADKQYNMIDFKFFLSGLVSVYSTDKVRLGI